MTAEPPDEETVRGSQLGDADREAGEGRTIASDAELPRRWRGIEGIPLIGSVWIFRRGYGRRSGPLLSAGIAYSALFSIAPLMLVTLEIAGFFEKWPGEIGQPLG